MLFKRAELRAKFYSCRPKTEVDHPQVFNERNSKGPNAVLCGAQTPDQYGDKDKPDGQNRGYIQPAPCDIQKVGAMTV